MMLPESESAWASVVLPVGVDVPARFAIPVQVRTDGMRLSRLLPADGRYHQVPSGLVTFLATLPDGRVLQTSTELPVRSRARITLQVNAVQPISLRLRPTLLDQQRTALRFLVQSSLDSYKKTHKPSVASALVAATDELRLRLTSHAAGVQFLQLLAPKAFPMFVAYAGARQSGWSGWSAGWRQMSS